MQRTVVHLVYHIFSQHVIIFFVVGWYAAFSVPIIGHAMIFLFYSIFSSPASHRKNSDINLHWNTVEVTFCPFFSPCLIYYVLEKFISSSVSNKCFTHVNNSHIYYGHVYFPFKLPQPHFFPVICMSHLDNNLVRYL